VADAVATKEIQIRVDARQAVAGLKDAKAAIGEAERATATYRETLKTFGANSKEAKAAQQALSAATKAASEALSSARDKANEAAMALARAKESGDASARVIKKLEAEVRAADKALSAASTNVAKMARETNELAAAAAKAASKERWAFATGIASAAGGAVTAIRGIGGAVAATGQWMADATERTAQLRAATAALSFPIEQVHTGLLRMVDAHTLTTAASKSMQIGITKSGTEFGKMAEAAAKLGLSVGIGAKDAINNLVDALATGSPEVLNNIGIILKQEQAYDLLAKKLGVATSQLTEQQKAGAFTEIALDMLYAKAAKLNTGLDEQAVRLASVNARLVEFGDTAKVAATEGLGLLMDAGEGVGIMIYELTDALDGAEESMGTATQRAQALAMAGIFKVQQEMVAFDEVAKELEKRGMTRADFEAAGGVMTDLIAAREKLNQLDREYLDTQQKIAELPENRMGPSVEEFEAAKELEKQAQERARKAKQAADARKREAEQKKREEQQLLTGAFSEGSTATATAPIGEWLAEDEAQRRAMEAARLDRRRQLVAAELAATEQGTARYEELKRQELEIDLAVIDAKRQTTDNVVQLEALRTEAEVRQVQARLEAQQRALEAERAMWAKREGYAVKGAEVLGGAITQITDAQRESEEAASVVRKRELASIARRFQNELVGMAVVEGVKAIVAAASYNYPGAALHGAAAAAATAGAVTLSAIAGGLEADVSASAAGGGGGGGAGAGPAAPERQRTTGGRERLEVPVSQDPTTAGLRQVQRDPLQITVVIQAGNFYGGEEAASEFATQVEREIRRRAS